MSQTGVNMKKIIVIGVGAQGSTIVRRMDEHPQISEIICADYDIDVAERLSRSLPKAKAIRLDAGDRNAVVQAVQGCDLIINGLPLQYNLILMEAALAVNGSYMDMAGPMEKIGFVESYKLIFTEWHKKFKDRGLTALVGCGSSPGLANLIAREAVEKIDRCSYIGIFIYEGLWAKKFTPFWWSPQVAFGDMAYRTFRFENGRIVTDRPFSRPQMMTFPGVDHPVRMVDHEHDEPVTMGLLTDQVLKGVKDVEFKYGGPHVELSEALYNMGLLTRDPVAVNGAEIVPMDLVLKLCPPAPKFPEEIKSILDGGLILEEGAFLVRVEGCMAQKPARIDCYVNAPGLKEAFSRSRLSHEAYLTGQCAAVFAKMMVEDVFCRKGAFVPEQLPADARQYCFQQLAELDVTLDVTVEETIV